MKRLNAGGNTKCVPSAAADKLTKMLAVLEALRDAGQLLGLQFWKPHLLTGDRKGIWSLSVTRNWRPTYWINDDEPSICDLDLEDYH